MVWKEIIFWGAVGGGNPTVPQREDRCSKGIQGDSTERLLATWTFPAWKKGGNRDVLVVKSPS